MRAAIVAGLVASVALAQPALGVQTQPETAEAVPGPLAPNAEPATFEGKLKGSVAGTYPEPTDEEKGRKRREEACAKVRAEVRPDNMHKVVEFIDNVARTPDEHKFATEYDTFLSCMVPGVAGGERWPARAHLADGVDPFEACKSLSAVLDAYTEPLAAREEVDYVDAFRLFEQAVAEKRAHALHADEIAVHKERGWYSGIENYVRELPRAVRDVGARLESACTRELKRPEGKWNPWSEREVLPVKVSMDKDLPMTAGLKSNNLVLVRPTCRPGVPSGPRRLWLGGMPSDGDRIAHEAETSVAPEFFSALDGLDCRLATVSSAQYCIDGKRERCDMTVGVRKLRNGKPHMTVIRGRKSVCPFEWKDVSEEGGAAGVHYHLARREGVELDVSRCEA